MSGKVVYTWLKGVYTWPRKGVYTWLRKSVYTWPGKSVYTWPGKGVYTWPGKGAVKSSAQCENMQVTHKGLQCCVFIFLMTSSSSCL